ncbi:extl3 protein, partial [Nannochloropsis gaditana]
CYEQWDQIPSCGAYNDKCFFHPDYGVAKVSKERWQGAQKAENNTWLEQRTSDRNEEHARNFNNYAALTMYGKMGDVIEFGAGPFTQSLTIFKKTGLKPKSVTLVEPLAHTYVDAVDACRYKNGSLPGLNTTIMPVPIENFAQDRQYDTVIAINFVEHVQDAFLAYDKVLNALNPGGILVFHERFWPDYDGIEVANRREFDLHPIRLSNRFGHWMSTEFDLLYEQEQRERWGNIGYYWIGRKRSTPMAEGVATLSKNMKAHAAVLAHNGFDEQSIWGNIYNGQDLEQSREYMSYASLQWAQTFCEVGFAGGHSTVAYLTAKPNSTIYSFDDYGKSQLTEFAYDIVKRIGDVKLIKGDSTTQVVDFAASFSGVFCDIISVDGAHHAEFPRNDLLNLKYVANYPNIVLIDDYHKTDWPAVYDGVASHVSEGSLKLRHVGQSSIHFRGKKKQWAIAEYELLTIICAMGNLDRVSFVTNMIAVASVHPVVQQILIIWNGPHFPDEVAKLTHPPNGDARVTVVNYSTNSLNNRYDPNLPIHTGAVMLLDDDLEIAADTISCAFSAWKRDPSKLYSFGAGRAISDNGYTEADVGEVETNFLLPRMIFHKSFLQIYSNEENKPLLDYVDRQSAHCDDIAFATVISKYTAHPMYYIPAYYKDLALPGISSQKDRCQRRIECALAIQSFLNWTLSTVKSVEC